MFGMIGAAAGIPDDQTFILELYQEFHCLMFRVAKRHTSNPAVQEEIVQESLVKLIRKTALLRTFSRRSLGAYISSTTRTTAIRWLKSEASCHARSRSLDDEAMVLLEAPLLSMDDLAHLRERREHLLAALDQLSPEDRLLLEGKYFLEESDETLAKLIGCKASSIRMKLTRARRRAFKLFEKEVHDFQ